MLLSVYVCSRTIKGMNNSGDNETIKIKIWYTLFILFLFINKKMLPWRCCLSFIVFLIVNPYFLLIYIHLKIVNIFICI